MKKAGKLLINVLMLLAFVVVVIANCGDAIAAASDRIADADLSSVVSIDFAANADLSQQAAGSGKEMLAANDVRKAAPRKKVKSQEEKNIDSARAANSSKSGPEVKVGLDFRNVDTSWYAYPGMYLDADFTFTGITAEWQYNFVSGNLTISPGIELGYFFSGDCDLSSGGYSESCSSATATEIGPYGEVGFLVAPNVSLLGRLGLAHLAVSADSPSLGSFDWSATDLYLAPGVKIDFNDTLAAMISYRFNIVDIDVSTDESAPNGNAISNESYKNSGFQIKVAFKF